MSKEIVFITGKVGDYMRHYRRKLHRQQQAPPQELPVLPVFPPPVHIADITTTMLGVPPDVQPRIAGMRRSTSTVVLARATPETDPRQERAPVAVLPGRRARTVYANNAAQPAALVQEGILKFAQQHPGVQVARICTSDFNIDILRLHDLVPFGPIQVESWRACEEFQPHNSVVIIYGPVE